MLVPLVSTGSNCTHNVLPEIVEDWNRLRKREAWAESGEVGTANQWIVSDNAGAVEIGVVEAQ
jgi:hypothetical protein